jgi:hypothetical protein
MDKRGTVDRYYCQSILILNGEGVLIIFTLLDSPRCNDPSQLHRNNSEPSKRNERHERSLARISLLRLYGCLL